MSILLRTFPASGLTVPAGSLEEDPALFSDPASAGTLKQGLLWKTLLRQEEFNISNEDANSLILEGVSDLTGTSFYNSLLQSLNLTTPLIQTTSLLYKDGLAGTKCTN